ncbi:uncharacterized protein LOC104584770 [Brachypodium distachyon]|uniref:Uncharacterized protein n=1 Tax=Brachypodium distachyon TaxID=15368 RepID=A0A0Q3J119_BRADI|nr:uncharacterized protein LOC104584770 [Brachypodium distachyon]KQJ92040.1 hypothetical protein BRADI_4g41373v3 [Brachypodium distachyon]|eukprot:XP_010238666.1 uncharacterized protein LOC104584770 [Brachypodium distachyon]
MAGGGRIIRVPALRTCAAAAVAACAVPVAVSLALLWLPLLCFAVAVVRFRRVMRTRRAAAAEQRCGGGGGGRSGAAVDAGDRLRLLQKYLEDQMELVGAEAGEVFFRDLGSSSRVES